MALDQPHPLDQWSVWFKSELAPADLEGPGVLAFLHHFADLGILEPAGENLWKLCGIIEAGPSSEKMRDVVRDHLEAFSRAEDGFAVAHFLGQQPESSPPNTSASPSAETARNPNEAKITEREIASDLSNLQIVKKVGRQLKPFLDFERETLSRLQGKYTQPNDARLIFNFILRQTQQKAEPKKWEQLSRKRHR